MPFQDQTLYQFHGTHWNEVSGVYGILDVNRNMLYIGQTDNLKRRHGEHCADTSHLMHRYRIGFLIFENITDPTRRTVREMQLIREYNPPCNRR